MDSVEVINTVRDGIWVLILISAPLMITALVVGLAVSLVQALTQIQEMTLTFVPKLIALGVVLLLSLPMIGAALSHFMSELSARIIGP